MIISHGYKLIFVTTPKSGSHTGFKLMEDNFGASARFNHNTHIPSVYKNYTSFTFVRNPYERFCSLYHACVINDVKHFVPDTARESILNYAKWLALSAKKHIYIRKDLMAPQYVWHRTSTIKHYIQIENPNKFFEWFCPDIIIDIPHELKRKHLTWNDVKTDDLLHYVNLWAGDDFIKYGYNKE